MLVLTKYPVPAALRAAETETSPEAALRWIQRGEDGLSSAVWTSRVEGVRGDAFLEMGRVEEAHAAYLASWVAGPSDEEVAHVAAALARSSMTTSSNTDLALEALQAARQVL